MLIRSIQLSDLPHLFPLIEKICDFHKSLDGDRYNFLPNQGQLYEEWLNELLTDSRNLCLLAEDDLTVSKTSPQIVAYLIATLEQEIPIYHLKEYGYIHDLWVEESHRRQGIAQQMIRQTVDHFKHLGVQQVRLNTLVSNDAALKLYNSCGFRASTFEMLIQCDRNTGTVDLLRES
jgi:ribosomal protein S18 acetylase RimI-like enzyme